MNFEGYYMNRTLCLYSPVHIDPRKRAPDIRRFKPNVPTLFIMARHPMVKMIPKSY